MADSIDEVAYAADLVDDLLFVADGSPAIRIEQFAASTLALLMDEAYRNEVMERVGGRDSGA